MASITHVIPQIGRVDIELFSPADKLYEIMDKSGEINRLNAVTHVGFLDLALPGITHSRWDYIASMLYLAQRIRPPLTRTTLNLGSNIQFRSMSAAVQVLAILTNIGHVPGTFSTEKGITRWLLPLDDQLKALEWPNVWNTEPRLAILRENLFDYLKSSDYVGMNRVLSVLKLAHHSTAEPYLHRLALNFYIPFILRWPYKLSFAKWEILRSYYQLVRRIAYLNLDAAFANVPVRINIGELITHLTAISLTSENELRDAFDHAQEILGAYEHAVYERVYHHRESRRVVAVVAKLVHRTLIESPNPADLVHEWLKSSDKEWVLPHSQIKPELEASKLIAEVSVRSYFLNMGPTWSKLEKSFSAVQNPGGVSCLVYSPWPLPSQIEPPHVHLDVLGTEKRNIAQIGRLLLGVASTYDSTGRDKTAGGVVALTRKTDLGQIYSQALVAACDQVLPRFQFRFDPWPLKDLGVSSLRNPPIAVWLSGWDLLDDTTKHVLRRRQAPSLPQLQGVWGELRALADLRDQIRSDEDLSVRKRRIHFIITSSIKVFKEGKAVVEFDGGIARVNTRSGNIQLFLSENKSGATGIKAANVLRKKLERKLGVSNQTCVPLRSSAYTVLDLGALDARKQLF